MNRLFHSVLTAALALSSDGLWAAPVAGEVTRFQTANGTVEECIRIAPFPDAQYSRQDRDTRTEIYCALDFTQLALCPKIWSTSPGTILYEIDADCWCR